MFLELDGQGPQYRQLIRALRAAILSGRLPAHARLPSTRELALELGCSRITALAAYEQLRTDGYIDGQVGSGSYVNALPIETMPQSQVGTTSITAQSRYAERARQFQGLSIAERHRGVRFDMQYGSSHINPSLSAIWARELSRAATQSPLGYGADQGLLALREQVCSYLSLRRGIQTSVDRVLIVSGTEQAIALTARVLINEGDTVAIEEPHYWGASQQFSAHGTRLLPIRSDNEGLLCSELPAVAPRLVLVTPAHQFPSGAVLSLTRRIELLSYADKAPCWIVEDDYDSELRYDSQPLATLHSLDNRDRVIYVGTLSKVMFGALRLGYMVLPQALRDDFVNAKCLDDRGCPTIEQAALAHFMEDGGFERHLRYITRELRSRRRELIEGLHRHAGERVEIGGTHAGMHVVVWLPDYNHAQIDALITLACERGLGLHSIAPHYNERPVVPGLMLGYCGLSNVQLRDATQLFGKCLDAIDAIARRHNPKQAFNAPRAALEYCGDSARSL